MLGGFGANFVLPSNPNRYALHIGYGSDAGCGWSTTKPQSLADTIPFVDADGSGGVVSGRFELHWSRDAVLVTQPIWIWIDGTAADINGYEVTYHPERI